MKSYKFLFKIIILIFVTSNIAIAEDNQCIDNLIITKKSERTGSAILACLQEMQSNIKSLETKLNTEKEIAKTNSVPIGAVVAFGRTPTNLCPKGWKEFEPLRGKVAVGAGTGIALGKALTERKLGDKGGAETHTLTIGEMPSHNHGGSTGAVGNKVSYPPTAKRAGSFAGTAVFSNESHSHSISSDGGSSSHNNMQPFHVLLYCERT